MGLALVAITMVAAACSSITEVPLPSGSRQFAPPPVYTLWWSMTESCSGRSGSLDAVDWYIVPDASQIWDGTNEVAGYWSSGSNRIVLAGSVAMNGSLVRHEMLHALLRAPGHPRSAFLGRCAGVVACVDACVEDGGAAPEPAPDAARVTSDSLEIGISVNPAQPVTARFGGYFTVTVTVHNPADHGVVALLAPPDGGPRSTTFSLVVQGAAEQLWRDDQEWDPEVTLFAPGETKRDVFDLHIGPVSADGGVIPGTYIVQGAYGGHASPPATVVVGP